jgi:hypothetical protein
MKRIHIILLIVIAAAIGLLISFLDLTTFETIDMAKKNPNKFFHVAARVDTSKAFEYDPQKDPNFCRFMDMEKVSRLVMSGKYTGEHFECKSIQLKCPSKYKEELDKSKKSSASAKL